MLAEPTLTEEQRTPWTPMVGLFLAQVLMSFNVAALPVSLGGIVADLGVAPTVASTTIVVYGLSVAALVMVGAKVGQRFGWVRIFRIVILVFALSSVLMIFGRSIGWLIGAQAIAGAAAAIIVPSLVALIAENYHGTQQATARLAGVGPRHLRLQRLLHRGRAGHPGRVAPRLRDRARDRGSRIRAQPPASP